MQFIRFFSFFNLVITFNGKHFVYEICYMIELLHLLTYELISEV